MKHKRTLELNSEYTACDVVLIEMGKTLIK